MKMTNPARFLTLFLMLAFAGGIIGCNTMEGAGEDIEAAGEGIEDAAD
ncbi:MAG TPA: entericidin A/B family lipoprotein [Longimicrobiaceae bacterium]|nr:entericidin A/B family lipoprotein [Longimicrobiaceae bacterium]